MALFKTKKRPYQAFAGIYSAPIVIMGADPLYYIDTLFDKMDFLIIENLENHLEYREYIEGLDSTAKIQYNIKKPIKLKDRNVHRFIDPMQPFTPIENQFNIIEATPYNIQETEDLVEAFPEIHFQVRALHRHINEKIDSEFVGRMEYLKHTANSICIVLDGYIEHTDPYKLQLIDLCSRRCFYPCYDIVNKRIYQCYYNRKYYTQLNKTSFIESLEGDNSRLYSYYPNDLCKTCPNINSERNLR